MPNSDPDRPSVSPIHGQAGGRCSLEIRVDALVAELKLLPGVRFDMGWKTTTGIVLVGGGLAAAITLPLFIQPRSNTQNGACIANLKQIQGAIEQYALENKLEAPHRVSIADISGSTSKMIRPLINTDITCPRGGIYSITTVGEMPRCSHPEHTL